MNKEAEAHVKSFFSTENTEGDPRRILEIQRLRPLDSMEEDRQLPDYPLSSDPVTYDDNGDIIPLSERFNEENEDIRYQHRVVDVDSGSAVVELSDDSELAKLLINRGNKSVSKVIADYIFDVFRGKIITLQDGREIIVDRHDAKKLSQYPKPRKTAELASIERIIQNAVLHHSDPRPSHNKFKTFHYYRSAVRYGNTVFTVELNVGEAKNDGRSHLYDLREVNENTTAPSKTGTAMPGQETGVMLTSGVSNDRVPQPSNDVNPVSQEISSAGTSIKQIPALFKHPNVEFGETNIDIGGGRFDLATNYLAERGTKNMLFDPYNQSEEVNRATLDYLMQGNKADTVTCANVLNVIAEPDARANVILEAAKAVKEDGKAYFMVYEGDGSGEGKRTGARWQNNRKTADYMGEIGQYFNSVQRKGKLIIASEVDEDLTAASWETTPGNATRYQDRDFRIDFNVPQLDTKALHEAVKGGEGTVENRFEVKCEKTDSGFAVYITDKDSGKTYDRAETVTEGNAKAEAERAAAVIRNIKRGRADSTSRSTAGIYIEPCTNAARSSAVPVSYEDAEGSIRLVPRQPAQRSERAAPSPPSAYKNIPALGFRRRG
ncbi:MAG: hypothetical protein IKG85_02200 [Clostridia bacterium]|nr:hypothetical protein [Clostridia bacterium]